jgi:hypothetical protein
MPFPDTISVRYTEEEAGYVTVRPLVRQTFRLAELADMVVSVSGKDPARVQQIFRAGTVVYNGFRYWWPGFPAEHADVAALLAPFPDDQPQRPFRFEEVTAVILEIGGGVQRTPVELTRVEAAARRFLRRSSAWSCIDQAASASPPAYEHYSHKHRADLFRRALPYEEAARLLQNMLAAAPRALRLRLAGIAPPSSIVFLCPRPKNGPG